MLRSHFYKNFNLSYYTIYPKSKIQIKSPISLGYQTFISIENYEKYNIHEVCDATAVYLILSGLSKNSSNASQTIEYTKIRVAIHNPNIDTIIKKVFNGIRFVIFCRFILYLLLNRFCFYL